MQLEDLSYSFGTVYSLRAADGDESVNIGAYRGNVSLSIFRKGAGRPIASIPMSRDMAIKLMRTVAQLKDAPPNTRLTVGHDKWNRELRKNEPFMTIVMFKDDRMMMGMEFGGVGLTPPVKCMFRSPSSLTNGSEPMTDADRSALGLAAFQQFLDRELPILRLLCKFNVPKQNFGGNGGGGGQRSGGGNYSGGGSSGGGGGDDMAF